MSCARRRTALGVLDLVERTLRNVEQTFGSIIDIQELPLPHREPVSIARHLAKRLPRVGCRRCWLRPDYCICDRLRPVTVRAVAAAAVDDEATATLPCFFRKIFVLMHHHEVGLSLDTAKIILAAFPETSRLVVGGIPSHFQASMQEMEKAIADGTCVVLYPQDGAPLATELFMAATSGNDDRDTTTTRPADVSKYPHLIVIDGTWEQARRLHGKYIPATTQHVRLNLSNDDDDDDENTKNKTLDDIGRQLRWHPIPWREIATCHALQLLAEDLGFMLPLREYHVLATTAVRRQQSGRLSAAATNNTVPTTKTTRIATTAT